jgi:hypothetical protein
MEGVELQFDSQETGNRGRPKLQLDVKTINHVERRCEELMITVALAKEERDKLVLLVEEQRQDAEIAADQLTLGKERHDLQNTSNPKHIF